MQTNALTIREVDLPQDLPPSRSNSQKSKSEIVGDPIDPEKSNLPSIRSAGILGNVVGEAITRLGSRGANRGKLALAYLTIVTTSGNTVIKSIG